MCIMASPVVSVTNTRIFAGSDPRLGRQVTVYAMAVQLQSRTGKGNAMILPVPIGTEGPGSIELIDLTALPDFFMPLDELFKPRTRSLSKGVSRGMDDDLEVHKVGSYDVSIVPSVDDVKRLNRQVFEVSADTEHTLRSSYPVGFAFLVAQLRESGEFHPLAYTHPIVGGGCSSPPDTNTARSPPRLSRSGTTRSTSRAPATSMSSLRSWGAQPGTWRTARRSTCPGTWRRIAAT